MTTTPQPNQPITSTTFLNGMGVDTHIAYTDGGYANIPNVIADLKTLGVTQVRDGISDGTDGNGNYNGSAPLSSYITMAQAGIQFTFIIGPSSTAQLQYTLNLINQVATAVPGSVVGIEGPNEINNAPVNFNGITGEAGALAAQQAIYAAVHADPALKGVPVDYFTGYATVGNAVGPDPSTTPGLADNDTQHPYPNFGQAPAAWVARAAALPNAANPATIPAVYTETGYNSGQVDEAVQAKYTLDLLLDTAQEGISKTYLYDLMDAYAPGSPQGDDEWGLFDYTKAPKPVATVIHNMTTLLQDTGPNAATFKAVPLSYSITGLPTTGNSMVIEKSNGTDIIAVWAEPQIWNGNNSTETIAPNQTVTVTLPTSYSGIQVFDPLAGTAPIASYTNSNTVTITVSDHPIFIQLNPVGGAAAVTTPDTLTVNMSEDAFNGDAQAIISIDGNWVGNVETVTALHSAGQSQNFTFTGNFGAGPHTVTVNFLNNLYAGTPTTDRNLYVNSITLDGATTVENAAQLSGGAANYSVQAGTVLNPPVLPTVSVTSQKLTQDTGISATDNITSNGAVTLSGTVTGTAGTTVQIVDGTTVLGNATITNGVWTYATTLAAGNHALHAVATDTLGHTASSATQSTIKVETAATLSIATPTEVATATTANVTVAGTITGPFGTTIELYNGTTDLGAATINGTSWSYNANLLAGTYNFTAKATNPAGTVSSITGPAYVVANTVAPVTIASTGSDTLVLNLSEDAYNGNAQFTVSVDGTQIGGIQTVTAQNTLKQTQTFTLNTNLTAGAHVVSISYINDVWGGSSTADRNLYVNSITLDGTSISEATGQYSNGTVNYAVQKTTFTSGGLTVTNSATTANALITGPAAVNTFVGSGANETYVMDYSDKSDTIINGSPTATTASGELLVKAVPHTMLWFQQSGNNLVVDVMGTTKQTVIQNWYAGNAGAQLQSIVANDGYKLDSSIQSLVQAMASFSAANPAFNPTSNAHTTLTDSYFNGALASAASSAWHK